LEDLPIILVACRPTINYERSPTVRLVPAATLVHQTDDMPSVSINSCGENDTSLVQQEPNFQVLRINVDFLG
jgi:hypothetical protein